MSANPNRPPSSSGIGSKISGPDGKGQGRARKTAFSEFERVSKRDCRNWTMRSAKGSGYCLRFWDIVLHQLTLTKSHQQKWQYILADELTKNATQCVLYGQLLRGLQLGASFVTLASFSINIFCHCWNLRFHPFPPNIQLTNSFWVWVGPTAFRARRAIRHHPPRNLPYLKKRNHWTSLNEHQGWSTIDSSCSL